MSRPDNNQVAKTEAGASDGESPLNWVLGPKQSDEHPCAALGLDVS